MGKENTFIREFEVKKYGRKFRICLARAVFFLMYSYVGLTSIHFFAVLPAFNVTLTPKKSHLSLDDEKLEIEVSARSV